MDTTTASESEAPATASPEPAPPFESGLIYSIPDASRHFTSGRWLPALILIALGVVFLAGNLFAIGAGALFIGLGAAFLLARVITGHYGYAVPAGILLGFGAFVALDEASGYTGSNDGWFFVLLGAGFLAVYLIGFRPLEAWPLIPAAVLAVFGLFLMDTLNFRPLSDLAWIGFYWPAALILVGVWLLLRPFISPNVRRPLATIGLMVLVLYGILAVAAVSAEAIGPMDLARPRVLIPNLTAPATRIASYSAAIQPGDVFKVDNPNGRTAIHAGNVTAVQVTATHRYWWRGQEAEVHLTPASGAVNLDTRFSGSFPFGLANRVDYVVEVPAGTPVEVRASSGDIEISGLSARVSAETSSGDVQVTQLDGPVNLRSSSGGLTFSDLKGIVTAQSSSGSIRGARLVAIDRITSSSGDVTLDGRFTSAGYIQTSSGDVRIRFAPDSGVQLDVTTSSGSIRDSGLTLTNRRSENHSLGGLLGAGEVTLRIQTSSGDVWLERLPVN